MKSAQSTKCNKHLRECVIRFLLRGDSAVAYIARPDTCQHRRLVVGNSSPAVELALISDRR
jgi:hypothetical protein